MTLARWNPFSTFTQMERDMQSLMDRLWGRPLLGTTGGRRTFTDGGAYSWRPAVDIYREGDHLVVRCEIPGIDPEKDLDVSLEGNVLHISGQKSFQKEVADEDLYLTETFFGSFQRDVLLPEGVEAEQLQANYEAGVLTVQIPLPEDMAARARKVPITVGSQKAITS